MMLRSFLSLVVLTTLLTIPRHAEAQGLSPRVEALETAVLALQDQSASQQDTIRRLRRRLRQVENNPVLALSPHVMVMSGDLQGVTGPHIIFKGANVHIQSGSGTTHEFSSLTGLGNLIVGYNENFGDASILANRFGSHNVVIGVSHQFLGTAGFVAGESNTISDAAASVMGGAANTASAFSATVSGGSGGTASGIGSSIAGGQGGIASGNWSHISNGLRNTASGTDSTVSGGRDNIASAEWSVVSGGIDNEANATAATVSGGSGVTTNVPNSHVP